MECLREWSQSVERILILGCGLHEPFTMGRSDGCVDAIQHNHLVLFLVTGTCSKQVKIMDFFLVGSWLDCCLELFHDYIEIDLVILNTKDSCDGSGLNTSESSKGSHPFVN